MIIPTIVVALISCVQPKFVNCTNKPFNDHDMNTAKKAKVRCRQVYPDAPCMKVFIKKYSISGDGTMHYNVVCGGKRSKYGKRVSPYANRQINFRHELIGIRNVFCPDKRSDKIVDGFNGR